MSKRAILIGVLLGLILSAVTYFNDHIINQTQLIGNTLPIGVFGSLVLLLLVVNPLLRLHGRQSPLRATELAVITVMGLAVCGWPGSGFFRTFSTTVAIPSHVIRAKPAWRSADVMSYVPGVSSRIAQGQVLDWPKLFDELRAASTAPSASPAGRIWAALPADLRQRLLAGPMDLTGAILQTQILDALNNIIEPQVLRTEQLQPLWQQVDPPTLPAAAREAIKRHDRFWRRMEAIMPHQQAAASRQQEVMDSGDRRVVYLWRQAEMMSQRANRAVLTDWSDHAIAPSPQGEGLLLANGDDDPYALDTLVRGWDGARSLWPWNLPWGAWWPTLRLWGGLALLTAAMAMCMVLIVHPQWSQRELLTYPIVRFVDQLTIPGPYGWLPRIARNRLFWIGLGIVIFIHLVNGLHAWFDAVPNIPLTFDFWNLRKIVPYAANVSSAYGLFAPRLYLSVVAFAFFLSTDVSLSLGLSTVVWVIFGSFLLSNGLPLENSGESVSLGAMVRAGAYIGSAAMILFVGRRYYLKLLGAAVGIKPDAETPEYAVHAVRVGAGCFVAAVLLLYLYADLDWQIGVLTIALVMLMMLVMTRISAETGAFFIQSAWMPMAVLTGVLGMQGLGPTTFIVVALASVILLVDPRELIAPFLANGLKMAEQVGDVSPPRATRMIGWMIFGGFAVALIATLTFQYNYGASVTDGWARDTVPLMTFNQATQQMSVLSSQGTLAESTTVSGWGHFTHAKPDGTAVGWLCAGLALVVLCTAARLRLPWWPVHPVLFLVWGTYPMAVTGFSFLMGWAIKMAVMRFMGTRGYRHVLPMMVGVIAGEVVSAIGWAMVGAIYYFTTHITPANYLILPG